MKLSIWNIYHCLKYSDMIPLIRDGSPTITSIRWIISRDLNPDTIYIGSQEEFFGWTGDSTLIVHRNDMILIQNEEPEEVFNDVSEIVERYEKWDRQLEECSEKKNGLTAMLACSREILQNPSFIYAPDGKALAIAPDFSPEIHWHWKEILEQRGLTEERIESLQKTIDLTNVFLDREPTVRDSYMGDHQYMHCSLIVNQYMAGHFVVFSMQKPFYEGLEYLVAHLIRHMQRYMTEHYEIYSPTSRIGEFISALIHKRVYQEKDFQLLLKLLSWDGKRDCFQLYLMKEAVSGEPVLLSKTQLKLSKTLKNCVVFRENNLLLLLVDLDRMDDDKKLRRHIEGLSAKFYCGISQSFQGIEQIDRYYKQAWTELMRCKELQLTCSYASEQIGAYLGNLISQNPMKEAYVNRSLLYLWKYDQKEHTQYYQTLRAWFYSGFHPTAAAGMIGIHRNSFNYRMDRIRELIPFDEIDAISLNHDIGKINEYLYSFMCLDYGRKREE